MQKACKNGYKERRNGGLAVSRQKLGMPSLPSLPKRPTLKPALPGRSNGADKKDKVLAAMKRANAAKNHYELLEASGQPRDTQQVVAWAKKAHRALATLLHPDTCAKLSLGAEAEAEATELFQRLGTALEILSDGRKRQAYDADLEELAKAALREEEAKRAGEAKAKLAAEQEALAQEQRDAEERARRRREEYAADKARRKKEKEAAKEAETKARVARWDAEAKEKAAIAAEQRGDACPAASSPAAVAPAAACRLAGLCPATRAPAAAAPAAACRLAGLCPAGGTAASAPGTAAASAPATACRLAGLGTARQQ